MRRNRRTPATRSRQQEHGPISPTCMPSHARRGSVARTPSGCESWTLEGRRRWGATRRANSPTKAVVCGLVFVARCSAPPTLLPRAQRWASTVSTSIPIAVLSGRRLPPDGRRVDPRGEPLADESAARRARSRRATIFTIPALFHVGHRAGLRAGRLLAGCGGVLGILAMVPLGAASSSSRATPSSPIRRGRACAEVLKSAERGGSGGRWIFVGLATGRARQAADHRRAAAAREVGRGRRARPRGARARDPGLPNGTVQLKRRRALLAVGFIVGYRAAVGDGGGKHLSRRFVLYPLRHAHARRGHGRGRSEGAAPHDGRREGGRALPLGVGAVSRRPASSR
jgi:hypothetical protein